MEVLSFGVFSICISILHLICFYLIKNFNLGSSDFFFLIKVVIFGWLKLLLHLTCNLCMIHDTSIFQLIICLDSNIKDNGIRCYNFDIVPCLELSILLLLKFEAWCVLLMSWSLFISLQFIFSKVVDEKIKTWLYNMYVFKRY